MSLFRQLYSNIPATWLHSTGKMPYIGYKSLVYPNCPRARQIHPLEAQGKGCFLYRALSSRVPAIPNVIVPTLGAHFRFAHVRVKSQGSLTWFANHFISTSWADVPLASAKQHLSCQKAKHAQGVHVFKLIANFPVEYSIARSKLDWNALSRSFLDISDIR